MNTIFTIGHSTHKTEYFISLLKKHQIEGIIDVRTYPYSKYNDQFNKEMLKNELDKEGIWYKWKGKNLGGLGKNVDFDETIDAISEVVKNEQRKMAVMCSEGNYKQCHRFELLEPAFKKRGLEVEHINTDGTSEQSKIQSSLI
jgi:uncharacterized protein (DUF488 family)